MLGNLRGEHRVAEHLAHLVQPEGVLGRILAHAVGHDLDRSQGGGEFLAEQLQGTLVRSVPATENRLGSATSSSWSEALQAMRVSPLSEGGQSMSTNW